MEVSRAAGPVLVVEDDASIRLLLREVLRSAGWHTVEAADGAGALAAVEAEAPAVVLLDVGLPDMDGLTVLERLKADPGSASVPVVMVTAWGDAERVERALAGGAHGYLRKPFDAGEVVACVEAAAGSGRPGA